MNRLYRLALLEWLAHDLKRIAHPYHNERAYVGCLLVLVEEAI